MAVRTCRVTCWTALCNSLTFLNSIARRNENWRIVSIKSNNAPARCVRTVVNHYIIAVAVVKPFNFNNNTLLSRNNLWTFAAREINTAVIFARRIIRKTCGNAVMTRNRILHIKHGVTLWINIAVLITNTWSVRFNFTGNCRCCFLGRLDTWNYCLNFIFNLFNKRTVLISELCILLILSRKFCKELVALRPIGCKRSFFALR